MSDPLSTNWNLNPGALPSFGGVTIRSPIDVSVADEGRERLISSGGCKTEQMALISNKSAVVTLTSRDLSLKSETALQVGKTGALILPGISEATGDGYAAGTNVFTWTAAEATIRSVRPGYSHNGESALVIDIRVVNSTGGPLFAYS